LERASTPVKIAIYYNDKTDILLFWTEQYLVSFYPEIGNYVAMLY